MNAYEAKQAARVERMRARAARLEASAESSHAAVRRTLDVIPMGQPILVGHHSEKKHRRDLARMETNMRRSVEASREAEQLRRRADRAESSDVISSDDPGAIAKLRAKLDTAEARHSTLLQVNARLRAGESPEAVAPMLSWWTAPLEQLAVWRSLGHRTIPLTNSGAEIRRLKARLAELEANAARPAAEPITLGDVRILEEDNRVRLYFPGKPSGELRAALRGAGFLWAPSVGAWQRKASPAARHAATELATRAAATPAEKAS